jgi:hypothetical protein
MTRKKRTINGNYGEKLKALRSFVDFNYDLRKPLKSAQKAKINRYYSALDRIQARANVVYRGKSKTRVREVQKISRNEFDALPGFKVAFVESSPANPTRVKFSKKGKPRLKSQYFDMGFIPFNMRALAKNPNAEITRAMNEDRAANWFRVSTGKYSMMSAISRRVLPGKLEQLMQKYSPSAENPELLNSGGKTRAHHWNQWLNGLIPLHTANQTELTEFLRRDMRDRADRKKKRKARKERQRVKDSKDNGL